MYNKILLLNFEIVKHISLNFKRTEIYIFFYRNITFWLLASNKKRYYNNGKSYYPKSLNTYGFKNIIKNGYFKLDKLDSYKEQKKTKSILS